MCILCITAYGGTLWWDLMELASNGGNSDNHIDYRALQPMVGPYGITVHLIFESAMHLILNPLLPSHRPRAVLTEIRTEQQWPIPLVAKGEVGRTSHHP